MEPEGSLPHSQMPATCPYPEPAWSNPYPHIQLHEDPSSYQHSLLKIISDPHVSVDIGAFASQGRDTFKLLQIEGE